MKRIVAVVAGAAFLIGTGDFVLKALAQSAVPNAAQTTSPPAAAAPSITAARAPSASASQVPDASAGAVSSTVPPIAATPTDSGQQGGIIKGSVKVGGVPLPGVAVTATNTQTEKKYATTTEIDGTYQMAVPSDGHYTIKTDLTGFSSATQEVVVSAAGQNGGLATQTADLKVDLASRAAPVTTQASTSTTVAAAGRPAAATAKPGTSTGQPGATVGSPAATAGRVARIGRGTQVVTLQNSTDQNQTDASATPANTDTLLPSLGDAGSTDSSSALANDSIAVTGQQGQINGLATFSQDDLQNRIGDMQRNGFNNGDIASTLSGVMQTGNFPAGPGGPGGGGPGGGGPDGGGFAAGGGGGGGRGGGGFGGGGGGGGFGGGGRGGFGGGGFGGGGFGGFRGQNPNAWHGTISYNGSDSALNATPRIFSGTPPVKPPVVRNTLTASVTGTPYITGWLAPNPKQFVFLSGSETRNSSPSIVTNTVPTLAQRYGDLTSSFLAQPLTQTVYDPSNGRAYGNSNCDPRIGSIGGDLAPTACIPQSEISPAAQALLSYYPLPNITPNTLYQNYQINIPGSSHSSQLSARYNRSFGAAPARGGRGGGGRGGGGGGGGGGRQNRNAPKVLRQSIAENFSYSHSASTNYSFSPLLGGHSLSNGYSLSSAYTVGYGRINSSATLSWNRSRAKSFNLFTYGATNPAVAAGILVGQPIVYNNPFYYGVPSVNMTGTTGVSGLGDSNPSDSINQTFSFSDFVSWSHKKHNFRAGLDFHRIFADSLGSGGALGSFTFSGFATEQPALQSCNPDTDPKQCSEYGASGSSFADYLIGQPQQTSITAGLNKIYLRGNSWDWYVQDDYRVKNGLTLAYGLRWEYFSPYSEENNRMVNLQLTYPNNSLTINNVCATAAAGCALVSSQFGTPPSLVNPDKSMYSPRLAIAWQPKFKWTKNTVVRSGYGINYNTGAYSRFASSMSFQQPFAITQTNTLSTPNSPTTCTMANMSWNTVYKSSTGYNCSTQSTQSNFGVDPNYRLGMVQVYNFGIQRTLPQGTVLNIDYTGDYAINQDIVRAPNRYAAGVLNPSSGQFRYEDSLGYQRSNALAVNLRERMHKGVSLQATYTYAHSIDDASSIGGSGGSIAQDDQDLGAEESNSSYDRRHTLSGNFVIEPPFGPNRAFLNKGGFFAKVLDGYSISGNYTFASGDFATPTYSGTPAEIAAGAGGSLRPNRVPGQPIHGAGARLSWFNRDAFAGACNGNPAPDAIQAPYCLQPGTYGNASRNSIELPGTVSISGSLSRTVTLGGTRSFEARINASNALNTVQYGGVSTSINSTTFGQVTGATGMRSFTYSASYRF